MEDAQSAPPRRKTGWKKTLLIAGGGLIVAGAIIFGIAFSRTTALKRDCASSDPAKAEKACTRLIDNGRKDADTYFKRAHAYWKNPDLDLAAQDFTSGLQLDPDNESELVDRGAVYIQEHQYEKSLSDFDQALKLKPDDGLAYNLRALDDRFLQQYAKAEQDYSKAIELLPDQFSSGPEGDLLTLYMEEGKLPQALSGFDKRMDSPNIALGQGKARFYGVSPNASIDDLVKAVSLKGYNFGYAVLWLHMARQRAGQDDRDEFQRNATTVSDPWQASVVGFTQGKIGYDELVKRAASDNADIQMRQLCDAKFYAAELLLPKQKPQAMDLFRKIDHDCRPSDPNHIAADYELGILPKH